MATQLSEASDIFLKIEVEDDFAAFNSDDKLDSGAVSGSSDINCKREPEDLYLGNASPYNGVNLDAFEEIKEEKPFLSQMEVFDTELKDVSNDQDQRAFVSKSTKSMIRLECKVLVKKMTPKCFTGIFFKYRILLGFLLDIVIFWISSH